MQVTEVTNEGLNRSYTVLVTADEIEQRISERLTSLAKTIKMPGFRPGKAPMSVMQRQYRKKVLGEILEKAVDDGSRKAIDDHEIKPALQPKIEVTSFDDGKDLEFSVDVEILPDVPKVDIAGIALTKQVTPVEDEAVDQGVDRLVKSREAFDDLEEARPAVDGDRVTMNFLGKVDGEPFEGGKAEDFPLVLGSSSMIPGFEDQIVGMSADDEKTIEVTFPEAYQAEELAGKAATFDIKILKIEIPQTVAIDDDFAKEFGVESLEDLRGRIRDSIERDYNQMARAKLKRALLDHLAETVKFDVPTGMVDVEFNAIWKQLEDEMQRGKQTFDDAPDGEEGARNEYRAIAERRVRLGLILSEVGTSNDITIEQDELQQALIEQARRFPGQEKQVIEYYQKTQGALEQLRAPIFEDKVVDFMFELANVGEQTVSLEELQRDPDDEKDQTEAAATENNA